MVSTPCDIVGCPNEADFEDFVDGLRLKIPVCRQHYIDKRRPAEVNPRSRSDNKESVTSDPIGEILKDAAVQPMKTKRALLTAIETVIAETDAWNNKGVIMLSHDDLRRRLRALFGEKS